jgi:hypothetical protein
MGFGIVGKKAKNRVQIRAIIAHISSIKIRKTFKIKGFNRVQVRAANPSLSAGYFIEPATTKVLAGFLFLGEQNGERITTEGAIRIV